MRRSLLVVLCALIVSPVFAKSLHWRTFDVAARLDADGRLHVREQQGIVFLRHPAEGRCRRAPSSRLRVSGSRWRHRELLAPARYGSGVARDAESVRDATTQRPARHRRHRRFDSHLHRPRLAGGGSIHDHLVARGNHRRAAADRRRVHDVEVLHRRGAQRAFRRAFSGSGDQ